MNSFQAEHPTDDALAAFALGEPDESVEAHIASCPSCSRQVREFRGLKASLSSLPEEEVPKRLRDKVAKAGKAKRWGSIEWFSLSCLRLLKSPLILVLCLVFAVVFLYILFAFLL